VWFGRARVVLLSGRLVANGKRRQLGAVVRAVVKMGWYGSNRDRDDKDCHAAIFLLVLRLETTTYSAYDAAIIESRVT